MGGLSVWPVLRRYRQKSLAQNAQYEEKISEREPYRPARDTPTAHDGFAFANERQPWKSSFSAEISPFFKRRLTETCDEAERAVIAKLLADEEAKGAAVPPKS